MCDGIHTCNSFLRVFSDRVSPRTWVWPSLGAVPSRAATVWRVPPPPHPAPGATHRAVFSAEITDLSAEPCFTEAHWKARQWTRTVELCGKPNTVTQQTFCRILFDNRIEFETIDPKWTQFLFGVSDQFISAPVARVLRARKLASSMRQRFRFKFLPRSITKGPWIGLADSNTSVDALSWGPGVDESLPALFCKC